MKNKSLAKNAGLNMFRTFVNMAFPLITYPYVTRVLGVDNIGKYNFSLSIIGYLALISGFGISSYAVREGARLRESKDKETVFVNQMFTIGLLATFCSYLILIVLCRLDKIEPYTKMIMIHSVTLIGTAIGVEWLNSIYEDFAYITARTLFFRSLSILFMFLFVRSEDDLYVYAIISALFGMGGYVCNYFHSRKFVRIRLTRNINLKRHFKPLLTFFSSNLTTTVFVNSDQTMLGLMCGDYYVGVYAIAVKVYNVLKNIFTSILFVVIPRVCVLDGQGKEEARNRLSEMTLKAILVLVLPMSIGIFAIADKAVYIVAGAEYIEGTSALRILAVSVFAASLASYVTYIHIVPGGYDKLLLLGSSISAGINVVLNVFMIPLWQHNGAAFTTLVSEFTVFFIEWLYVKPKMNYREILKTVAQTLVSCLLMVAVIFLADKLIRNIIVSVLIEVIVGALAYYAAMLLFRNTIVLFATRKIIGKVKK